MSTLVMTVGTGRSRKDIAQALLFSIARHKPARVLFFCSPKTRKETMPLVEPALQKDRLPYEVCVLEHEDDVEFLYEGYLDQLRKYRDVVVDFTSGTKAMSAAVFAAAIAIEARTVSYVIGPRDSGGRVTESTDVASLYPQRVLAERQLDRAKDLFNRLDFHAAAQLADPYRRSLAENTPLKAWAKTIWMVASAYDLWERFCWKEAASKLRKAVNPREGLVGIDVGQLAANAEFVEAVNGNDHGAERLVDLAQNAQRRVKQERFDDALARLYRAYEYLIQNCLKNDFKLDANKFTLDDLKGLSLSEKTLEKFDAQGRDGKEKLNAGLRVGMELLAELNHPVGKVLMRLYWNKPWSPTANLNPKEHAGPLQNWLNQRNESFMAHGTTPAKEETVKCLLNEYENLLRDYITQDGLATLQANARPLRL